MLGNIKNHYEGTGGNVDIVLVVHGPALAASSRRAYRPRSPAASPAWCSKGSSRKPAATPCGAWTFRSPTCSTAFHAADKGGVVKLAELQSQGYAYLRP